MGTITAQTAIAGIVSELSDAGKTVVLATGCFDLLHDGHRHLFRAARKLGDTLIVALNGDEAIRELKGPHRPLQKLQQRIEAVAREPMVDYVLPFYATTADQVLLVVQPDIWVKGGDWTATDLPEAETASIAGISIEIVPLLNGHSTTGMKGG